MILGYDIVRKSIGINDSRSVNRYLSKDLKLFRCSVLCEESVSSSLRRATEKKTSKKPLF